MNCRHTEHQRGKRQSDIYCRQCNIRMGCSTCCEIPMEIVCLNCKDWALEVGLEKHGRMIVGKKFDSEQAKA